MFGFRTYDSEDAPVDATFNPVLVEVDVQLYNYNRCPRYRQHLLKSDGSYGLYGQIACWDSQVEAVNKYTINHKSFM